MKKRGRKPKNKLVVNDNPCFDKDNNTNIIIKIKNDNTSDNTLDNISDNTLENTLDNISDNISDNTLDNISDNTLDNTLSNINSNTNNCYICKSNNIYKILPIKYIDNIFYVNNYFCSEECIEKYIFNKCKYNKYEIYSLYLFYKNMEKSNKDIKIKYNSNKN